MTDTATPAPATPKCEARTGVTPGAFGFTPTPCEATRGLRALIDAAGDTHWFCPAGGHAEAVALRFGAIRQLKAQSRAPMYEGME